MSKFPNWTVIKRVDAASLAQGIPDITTKVAATTITSNVTPANDSELAGIALGVGTWEIEVMLWATGVAAGGGNLKTAWAFTTGTLTGTPIRTTIGPAATSVAVPNVTTIVNLGASSYNTAVVYGLASTTAFAVVKEECPSFVVATAGTFSVQVAQGTSNATATVVQPGSRVKVRQIA